MFRVSYGLSSVLLIRTVINALETKVQALLNEFMMEAFTILVTNRLNMSHQVDDLKVDQMSPTHLGNGMGKAPIGSFKDQESEEIY